MSIVIVAVYFNTFHASWHLDDQPNILDNNYLHLQSLHPAKLIQTFFTNPHYPDQLNNKVYRPVSCLSFALNWYFGKNSVIGYHLVNIAIHILTAYFIFLFCIHLFKTPRLENDCSINPVAVSLLASALWALNPIQTQAVTYIVQRMAQLAALFYVLGLYAYLKSRFSNTLIGISAWMTCCLVSYFLGIFSKPNAAMMPIAILLIEISFFQNLSHKQTQRRLLLFGSMAALLIISMGIFAFLKGNPLFFLEHYQTRSFTLYERALTQPRVILFYLSQIFFPAPSRFSIVHDIVLSSSFFTPWTTLPSILIVFFLLGFSVLKIRNKPVLSFSILFFFVNHIIESSIVPLEIIFEHRNYLPSFFLFLPAACFMVHLLSVYKQANRAIYALTILLIVSVLTAFSVSTYIRNQAWKDDITLWRDAMLKAPNHSRPFHVLGVRLAWGDNSDHPNRFDMALHLFEQALGKDMPSTSAKADIYGNMALIYFHKKKNPEKAFVFFNMALAVKPDYLKIRRDYVEALILNKDFETALANVDILLSRKADNGRYHYLKGHILLWLGQYHQALNNLKQSYALISDRSLVLLDTAVALTFSEKYSSAEELLLQLIQQQPEDIALHFAIIQNNAKWGRTKQALLHAKKTLRRFNDSEIRTAIDIFRNNPKFPPFDQDVIVQVFDTINSKTEFVIK